MSFRRFSSLALLLGAAASTAGAAPDIAPPKMREAVVADAARVAKERDVPAALPAPLANPFVPKEDERVEERITISPSAPALAGADLLATLAARIPSSGTVIVGGEPILLLGQKRLKVGDTFAISFEGQTYELSIAGVTSTSFTVKRGENIYTRPVRISAASATTPATRP